MKTSTANAYLFKCASSGDVAGARVAFEHGADANCVDPFGQHPLLLAARRCDHAMVALLVKRGADPRCLGDDGMYPMALAAVTGRVDVIDALGTHCWDAESPSTMTPSALENALLASCAEAASHLVRHGADVHAPGPHGETMLMRMSALGLEAAVQLLLDEGALWFSTDDLGLTALDYARRMHHERVLALLLQHAQSQPLLDMDTGRVRVDRFLPCVASSAAQPPASPWAALKSRLHAARERALWSFGSRAAAVRRTVALMRALHHGDLHRAQLLLQAGGCMCAARDGQGVPLTMLVIQALALPDTAAREEDRHERSTQRLDVAMQLLQALVQGGAQPHACDPRTGNTVMHALLEGPWARSCMELVDQGLLAGLINRSNARLDRPLHLATRRRDLVAVKGLLDRGCDRNPVNRDGFTPLHHCAFHVDSATAELLVHAGANPELRTRRGQTVAAILASIGQRTGAFEALLTAWRDIGRARTIFCADNPLASAAKAWQPIRPNKPKD